MAGALRQRVSGLLASCFISGVLIGASLTFVMWHSRTETSTTEPTAISNEVWRGKHLESNGAVYALGLHTPILKHYAARWQGRGPYLEEATASMQSIRSRSPKTKIALITDEPEELLPAALRRLYHVYIYHPTGNASKEWTWRVTALRQSPWYRTLHLDADTKICSDLQPLFELLEHHDMAATIEPPSLNAVALRSRWLTEWALQSNASFTDLVTSVPDPPYFHAAKLNAMNPGTMLFRASPVVLSFLEQWADTVEQTGANDMDAFQRLYPAANIRYLRLPHEHSLRLNGAHVPFLVTDVVRIIHSRDDSATCEKVNGALGPRLLHRHAKLLWKAESVRFFRCMEWDDATLGASFRCWRANFLTSTPTVFSFLEDANHTSIESRFDKSLNASIHIFSLQPVYHLPRTWARCPLTCGGRDGFLKYSGEKTATVRTLARLLDVRSVDVVILNGDTACLPGIFTAAPLSIIFRSTVTKQNEQLLNVAGYSRSLTTTAFFRVAEKE